MQIQQLSVFIENKPGRMAEVTEVLAEANIDIRAISVADTRDFGILRVIVDKPKEAVEALKDDKPGAFSKAVRLLSNEGFDVEYMYAFISRDKGKAFVIIRLDNGQKAAEALHANGFEILSPEAIYKM